MKALSTILLLRAPLAALALCAILAQQVVGLVLTASPALAYESGFSLCLSTPPPVESDPRDAVQGAGFCPCTLQMMAALSVPAVLVAAPATFEHITLLPPASRHLSDISDTGPPPARGPPTILHTA